jgi:hypothetical protein
MAYPLLRGEHGGPCASSSAFSSAARFTVGAASTVDTVSVATAEPVMVNWDVVAKNLDTVTTLARAGWKKITG